MWLEMFVTDFRYYFTFFWLNKENDNNIKDE
jgi:hypothetical protein